MQLFVIIAVGKRGQFRRKADCLRKIAACFDMTVHIPEYNRTEPTFDLSKTIAAMNACDLILADLTYERPSCYYELGLAEALGRPIIAAARRGTRIHQTSHRSTVSFYESMLEFTALVTDQICHHFPDIRLQSRSGEDNI